MLKNIHIWLPSYIKQKLTQQGDGFNQGRTLHIMFCLVDHFEPSWNNATYKEELNRINTWVRGYPEIAKNHYDSRRRYPQHTFFYPAEEYRPEHLDKLTKLCKDGFGDVEIHLHHDNDTSESLEQKIEEYKNRLVNHGLLSSDGDGKIRYGFIHGNWALDNSRKDGKWCGVNNELQILKKTGCYADFTLPSAPSDTQTKKINSVYYAKDDPIRPKSHNSGVDVEVGKEQEGDLMIIQGPLALNWKSRKWGIFPQIENGEISHKNPPTEDRIDLWIRQGIHIKRKPNWIFVKVHTHGAQEKNWDVLLGRPMQEMISYLENKYNDGKDYILYYVTAREMYNLIKAAEGGKEGEPSLYRDYLLKKINKR